MHCGDSDERAHTCRHALGCLSHRSCSGRYTRCGLSDPRATTRRCYGQLFVCFLFGLFCLSAFREFTCSSWEAYTPDMLSPGDISVDSHAAPSHVAIHLKRSKNDPFAVGTILHLGITGDVLCPVTSMLGYLAIRPLTPGPLFLFEDGCTLSRPKLVHFL